MAGEPICPEGIASFDLSTLNLSPGTHSITVKARAKGYKDSVESNALSYVVEGEETPTEYTVSGTWYFNETISESNIDVDVSFENANGTIFIGMSIGHGTMIFNRGGSLQELAYYSSLGGWQSEADRTITFDGVQTVSKEFYDWFKANAVQKLAAPRISIPEENILLIEQGDGNANTYSIRIDGTQKDTQNAPNDSTPLSYNLSKLGLSAGNYTATVVATAEGYIDSDSSNEQPIKVVESGKTHSGGSN